MSGCCGCIDWVQLGTIYVCNYFGRTGKLRSQICRLGKYCTVKSTRGKKNTRENGRKTKALNWDEQKALEAYRKGGNDSEIAAKVGTSRKAIYAWRKRKLLKANYTKASKKGVEIRES